MNNFEVIRIFSRMIESTKKISIESRICFINKALAIDKNSH